MLQYLAAARPAMGLLAAMVVMVGFRLHHVAAHPLAPIVVLVAALTVTATMIWDDYFDRFVDLRKGKTHAAEHASTYRVVAMWFWLASFVLATFLIATTWPTTLTCYGLLTVGGLYRYTKAVPALAAVTVAGLSATLPFLASLTLGEPPNDQVIVLAILAFTIIFCREIVKDIEDFEVDHGSNQTLPQLVGIRWARPMTAVGLGLLAWSLGGPAAVAFCGAAGLLLVGNATVAKWCIDGGILLFIVPLALY